MSDFIELRARFLFRFKTEFIIRPVTALRTTWLRFQGMVIGTGTDLPHCYITWPHQVSFGNYCRIEHDVYFHYDGIFQPGPSISFGNNCFIGAGSEFNINQSFTAGDFCLIGAGSRFIDHGHNSRGLAEELFSSRGFSNPIVLGDYVWIGANCVILHGIRIGNGAIIGAGSCVTKDVPDNQIWGGTPARMIGTRTVNNN